MPEPDGPIKTINLPSSTENEISFKTQTRHHQRLSMWHAGIPLNIISSFILKKQPTIKNPHNFMGMKYKMSKADSGTRPDSKLVREKIKQLDETKHCNRL